MGIVVGIAGVSRAGKSTLSELIKEWYPSVLIFSMDDFVVPEHKIPKIKNETDWEIPESVDYGRLSRAVASAKPLNKIVIVEGILIFCDDKILPMYDRKILIEIDYDTFISRKRVDKRWVIPDWYQEHIWTSHIVYGLKNSENALKISGSRPFDKGLISSYIDTGMSEQN